MEKERNDKIWVFNAGDTFTGNPKWLFIYMNKFRKDIKCYWFCNQAETLKEIRKLGFKAYSYKSKRHVKIQKKAGVFVSNQVKEVYPKNLIGAKFLNLWHGVGCKSIERALKSGRLAEKVAKKYIKYNQIYKNNQIFLVTSPIMEKHFKEQCCLEEKQLIRSGYPACMYRKTFEFKSYNHNLLKQKGLDEKTKIAIYAPTFREKNTQNFICNAFPNMEKLIKKLQDNNMLLILKMHPLMENDYSYVMLKEKYKDCKNILFWNKKDDIYEVFNQIDLAIIDYSSIFYDMLSAGVPNFIRYIFDYDNKENVREFVFDYKEMTCGKICNNFDELLTILDNYQEDNEKDRERIKELFWKYDKENGFEEIIEKTLNFQINPEILPTLHSFDIFDTLVTRKTVVPDGIFFYVKEKMEKSNLNYPSYLIKNYVRTRKEAERNVRDFYIKTLAIREDEKTEIQFYEIFEKLKIAYNLSDEQVEFLKNTELEAEYENIIPIPERIDEVKELIENNEEVILISDMYLSKEVLKEILCKIDSVFENIPLYVSSEYGVQKSDRKLFLKVYGNLDYKYSEWIHHGDNKVSDIEMPKKLGITTVKIDVPELNPYEKHILGYLKSYDGQVVSKMLRKYRLSEHVNPIYENYVYSYAAMYMVPYVSFILKDAINRKIDTLYFVSRDGHYLKIIADEIIKIKGYNLKTKYIYGSRKAWRVPSYIDKIDDEFFSFFGNFTGVSNIEELLEALNIDEENFKKVFPQLTYLLSSDKIEKATLKACIEIFKDSEEYRKYLLKKAKKDREIVEKYLKQEINFDENYAFIDYWARGYTQDCLARIINHITNRDEKIKFYYARSIYPTQNQSERINFCTATISILFVEAIFSNLPYKSISEYIEQDGKIVPKIRERKNNSELHEAMENVLKTFCNDLYGNNLLDEDRTEKELFYAALEWTNKKPSDLYIRESIGGLKYTPDINGEGKEFAPAFTYRDVLKRIKGEHFKDKTKSVEMSLARSSKQMKKIYAFVKNTKMRMKKSKANIKKKLKKIIKR